MNRFYLLVITLFILGQSTLKSEVPEFLNSRDGIEREIQRVEDEILKRRALADYLVNQADRWYFYRLIWWQDSLMAWKQADQEYERIALMKQEVIILKKLLTTFPAENSSTK